MSKFNDSIKSGFGKEVEHFKKTGIPRCQICKKNMIPINEFTWKSGCEHMQDSIVMVGGFL